MAIIRGTTPKGQRARDIEIIDDKNSVSIWIHKPKPRKNEGWAIRVAPEDIPDLVKELLNAYYQSLKNKP